MLAKALGTRTWERRDVIGKWDSEIQGSGRDIRRDIVPTVMAKRENKGMGVLKRQK